MLVYHDLIRISDLNKNSYDEPINRWHPKVHTYLLEHLLGDLSHVSYPQCLKYIGSDM